MGEPRSRKSSPLARVVDGVVEALEESKAVDEVQSRAALRPNIPDDKIYTAFCPADGCVELVRS